MERLLYENITIRVDLKLKKAFVKKAKSEGHSPSTFLRKVIEAYTCDTNGSADLRKD